MNTYATDIPLSVATAAFDGVSWFPEKRGPREVEAYCAQLEADRAELDAIAAQFDGGAVLETEWERYRAGYRKRTLAYLYSSARCVSSWIAGPSNFPAARMNKRADVCHKRLSELFDFRTRALAAIRRKLRPDTCIRSSDANALEKLEAEINTLTARQSRMKEANATIRRTAKHGREAQVLALQLLGMSEGAAREMLKPDCMATVGYAPWQITNNGANIRRLKGRLVEISRKRSAPESETVSDSGIRVEAAPSENRVRIFFPGVPAADVRAQLKQNGFRWAPSQGAWSAYHNSRTVTLAERIAAA